MSSNGWNVAKLAAVALLVVWFAAESLATPVKVLAWNVEWFPGRFPDATPEQERQHMDEVQMTLKRLNPDVLVLVEVRSAEAVREAVSVLEGYQLNVISTFEGRPQQIAIASRFPLVRGGTAPWVRVFTGPPRGFVFAELQLPDRACLQVVGVHWKSNRGLMPMNFAMREISAVQLREFMSWLDRTPGYCKRHGTIIAGDMNTSLDADRFAADDSMRYLIGTGLHWPFAALPPEKRITWLGNDYHSPVHFDHFLTDNVGAPTARVVRAGMISDHSPIELVIRTEDILTNAPSASWLDPQAGEPVSRP